MNRTRLIFGLGNSGPVYAKTRHNLGARAVLYLASRLSATLKVNNQLSSVVAVVPMDEGNLILARSTGFMNLSGGPVKALVNYYQVSLRDLLIVHDDARLMIGQMQWQQGGPQRGQNGLRSIVGNLATEDFLRLRLGIASEICHPGLAEYTQRVSGFVLSPFTKDEEMVLDVMMQQAADQMYSWIQGDRP